VGPIRAASTDRQSNWKRETEKPEQRNTAAKGETIKAHRDMDQGDGARQEEVVRGGVSFDDERC